MAIEISEDEKTERRELITSAPYALKVGTKSLDGCLGLLEIQVSALVPANGYVASKADVLLLLGQAIKDIEENTFVLKL